MSRVVRMIDICHITYLYDVITIDRLLVILILYLIYDYEERRNTITIYDLLNFFLVLLIDVQIIGVLLYQNFENNYLLSNLQKKGGGLPFDKPKFALPHNPLIGTKNLRYMKICSSSIFKIILNETLLIS